MQPVNLFPAKILLFGEYTVLKGSQAFAVPLPAFSGIWRMGSTSDMEHSRQHLRSLREYLTHLQESGKLLFRWDGEAFTADLHRGLCFESNIPEGYGAGSSGAVSAALYAAYAIPPHETRLGFLKDILAQIEGCFHGASSGLDPLVSYLRQPVWILPGGDLTEWPTYAPPKGFKFFLLDTHISRRTAPLVSWFMEQCRDPYFEQRCQAEWAPLTDDAIYYCRKNEAPGAGEALFEACHQISHFQYRYLDALIPEPWKPLWLEGLSSDQFKLKLCGAGGGGFLLGVGRAGANLPAGALPVEGY